MDTLKAYVTAYPQAATAAGVWLGVALMLVLLAPACVREDGETSTGLPTFQYVWRNIAILATLGTAAWYYMPTVWERLGSSP